MTLEKLIELFDNSDEFLKFERIQNPKHPRPDICAFLLLHELSTPTERPDRDMVSCATHDEIFLPLLRLALEISPDEIAGRATEEDILTLIRCGVRYSSYDGGFVMFV